MCKTGRKAISESGEVFSARVPVSGAFGALDRLVQNASPSLEIAHFLPLLHNVIIYEVGVVLYFVTNRVLQAERIKIINMKLEYCFKF